MPDESKGSVKTLGEADRLLELAERLHESIEATSEQRRRLTAMYVATAVLLIGILFSLRFSTVPNSPISNSILIGVPTVLVSVGYVLISEFGRRKKVIRRDARALDEIIDLLRETESIYAENEKWSTLERAQFRIRMARFDIGPAIRSSRKKVGPEDGRFPQKQNRTTAVFIGEGASRVARSPAELFKLFDNKTTYEASEMAKAFTGKSFEAKVWVTNLDIGDRSSLTCSLLSTGPDLFSHTIHAYFEGSAVRELMHLRIGDPVQVRGTIDKVEKYSVWLEKCELTSSLLSEPSANSAV